MTNNSPDPTPTERTSIADLLDEPEAFGANTAINYTTPIPETDNLRVDAAVVGSWSAAILHDLRANFGAGDRFLTLLFDKPVFIDFFTKFLAGITCSESRYQATIQRIINTRYPFRSPRLTPEVLGFPRNLAEFRGSINGSNYSPLIPLFFLFKYNDLEYRAPHTVHDTMLLELLYAYFNR